MIRFPFFKARPDAVAALYGDIVAQARAPIAYRDYGVADTFEGRFERIVLITTLVLRRLASLGPAGEAPAQALVDRVFAEFDEGMRRLGVGDLSVGKKVKALARGFYGRAEAYTKALDSGSEPALRAVLSRNLFAGQVAPEAIRAELLGEITALVIGLDEASLNRLLAGGVLASHSKGQVPNR